MCLRSSQDADTPSCARALLGWDAGGGCAACLPAGVGLAQHVLLAEEAVGAEDGDRADHGQAREQL